MHDKSNLQMGDFQCFPEQDEINYGVSHHLFNWRCPRERHKIIGIQLLIEIYTFIYRELL
jgi:hypothetical protein